MMKKLIRINKDWFSVDAEALAKVEANAYIEDENGELQKDWAYITEWIEMHGEKVDGPNLETTGQ